MGGLTQYPQTIYKKIIMTNKSADASLNLALIQKESYLLTFTFENECCMPILCKVILISLNLHCDKKHSKINNL